MLSVFACFISNYLSTNKDPLKGVERQGSEQSDEQSGSMPRADELISCLLEVGRTIHLCSGIQISGRLFIDT